MSTVDIIATTPEAAHSAVQAAWQHAKVLTQSGKRVRLLAEEAEDDRSLQQNRFYWKAVLCEVEDQARIQGQRWAKEAWHELFKRMFLGYEVKRVKVAGRKRATVIRRLRSTTGLKVKPMSTYLEQVQAFAAGDLGVRFSVQRWEEWTR